VVSVKPPKLSKFNAVVVGGIVALLMLFLVCDAVVFCEFSSLPVTASTAASRAFLAVLATLAAVSFSFCLDACFLASLSCPDLLLVSGYFLGA
jgi:hypothetical protein